MTYKIIKLIFLIINFVSNFENICAEDEIIDCSNDELVTSVFNDPMDLSLQGIIKIYENVTINEILTTSNNEFDIQYIDARLEISNKTGNETKNLVIFTTDQFENYAKEQTATRISLKITLGCGMGKERILVFFQPLKEGNYFSPVFSQDLYELIIPTPIFAGFDLTAFVQITAKDDDLTRNQIVFTSNESIQHHISVGTKNVTSADKKTYFANITLEKIYLELPQQIEFDIVATDNGDPPKSSKASVIVRSDPNRSLPAQPKFVKALYKGLIDNNLEMEPIHIQLINGTYNKEVTYTLSGLDTQGFQLMDNKNGTIQINWNSQNLNRSVILQHKTWELEIKAEHTNLADFSTTTILVDLIDFQNYFHFMSTFYEGQIDEMGDLQILPIIFNPFMFKPDIEFRLLENPHLWFNLSIQSFSIQLQLTSNFTLESIDSTWFIKLPLQANWEHLSTITYLVIQLPQLNTSSQYQQMFQFEKPLYVGKLNETYGLEFETIVLQTDANKTQQIDYNLSGNGSSLFYIAANKTQLKIGTNFTSTSNFNQLNTSFLMVLEAKNENLKTYTSLVINVPQRNQSENEGVFSNSLIIGKILINNSTQNLSLDSIFVNGVENLQNYRFRLEGDESLNFDVRINLTAHRIDLLLNAPLSAEIVDTKQFLNLTLHAELTGLENKTETLLILIELPKNECPPPIKPIPDPPQFSSNNYVFTAFTNRTGSLGVVKAFSKGLNVSMHYNLEVQSDILAQRLSINPFTGELMLYGRLDEGNYLFNITAENLETLEKAHVNALLKIQPYEECKLFEGTAVEKTLVIKHIDEERPFHGLWNMKFNENCTFHIVKMWPNDKDYVYINEIFYMLDAIAIDREDPIFENMTEPQITVKLRLKCAKEDSVKSIQIELPKDIEIRTSEILYTEDIDYSPDIMWLHIKIDDINDNSPEFKLSEGPQYLGYPSGNVAFDIYPEYLTQIEAYDRDVGFNAKIKYSMRDNEYFDIESITGKIYPRYKMMSTNQQTELIVLATDQDGDGLISGTVVIVKALTPDFYSLITIRENVTRSKDEIEQELSKESGYNMNIIKMSYLPQMEKRSNDNRGLICKAWVYAYKSHQLVECKELQEKILDKSLNATIVNIESYDEVAIQSTQTLPSNLGYIVAVSLLSLISGFSIIFIIWRFYYYPSVNTNCDTKPAFALSNHGNGQQITGECSHGADNIENCIECNNQRNHVKFNDLVESVNVVEECQRK